MRSVAHTMPIYLLGSLQYFADVRTANAISAAVEERYAVELQGIVAAINGSEQAASASETEATTTPGDSHASAEARASGVGGGEGEGR